MAKDNKKKTSRKEGKEVKTDRQDQPAKQVEQKTELPAETEALKDDNQDLNDRLLRLRADFDNFRKRTIKERQNVVRRSNEKLMSDLIPVLDHFEMGLQTARDHQVDEAVYDGFKLVYEQLVAAIEKAGVVRIDAEGEEFNPHLHECISHLPSENVPEGAVATQTRCGYKLGNYVLRAAQVVVSSGPPNAENDGEEVEEEKRKEED